MSREVLTLPPSRRRFLLLALFCFFVAGGTAVQAAGGASTWIGIALFFLAGTYLAACAVPALAGLDLSPEGFTVRAPLRRTSWRWDQVELFGTSYARFRGLVVSITYVPEAPYARLRRFSRAVSGSEGTLPDTYRMPAEDLAALLNRWRLEHGR